MWVKYTSKHLVHHLEIQIYKIQKYKWRLEKNNNIYKDKILLYQQRNRNIFGQEGQKKKENGIYEPVQQYDFIQKKQLKARVSDDGILYFPYSEKIKDRSVYSSSAVYVAAPYV